MNAAEIQAALEALVALIDREVEIARSAYAAFRNNCNPVLVAAWSLDSPPGHLPLADKERLARLANTVEVAVRCQAAAANAKELFESLSEVQS